MAADTAVPQAPTVESEGNPGDFIEAWGLDNIGAGVPSPETLAQVSRALHAVSEFLVEPISRALKQVIEDVGDPKGLVLTEDERPVTYADIGRLICWTDELRKDIAYLLDPIVEIALLAHEDLNELAAGYVPDGATLTQHSWNKRLRRLHGLGEVL